MKSFVMKSFALGLALVAASVQAAYTPAGDYVDNACYDSTGNQLFINMSNDCTLGSSVGCGLFMAGLNTPPNYHFSQVTVQEKNGFDTSITTAHPKTTGDPLEPMGAAVLCSTSCSGYDPGRMQFTATAVNGSGAFFEVPPATEFALDAALDFSPIGYGYNGHGDILSFTFSSTRLGWVHVRVDYDCDMTWAGGHQITDHADFVVKVHP